MQGDNLNKTYYLATLGCSKNEIDSEGIESDLRAAGLMPVADSRKADLVLVNSCGFINDAKVETIHTVLSLHQERKRGSVLVLCGCLPARYNLTRSLNEVDIFLPSNKHRDLVPKLQELGWQIGRPISELRRLIPGGPSGYLRISEGCDNRCAYCAIPDIKGPFTSRPPAEIIREAEFLCEYGVKELVLIGQDTTLFGKNGTEEMGLGGLMERLSQIEDCEWIRLMYAHPAHLSSDQIEALACLDKVVKYIDLPLQHINDRMLKAMNRRTDRKKIESLIDDLRKRIPGIALRTTFIVGFPGEKDEEFAELLDFLERIGFDSVGAFKYSPEEGTPAYRLPERIDEETIEERYLTLLDIQNMISNQKLTARIGKRERVLVEGIDSDGRGLARASFQAPEVDGQVIIENCDARPGEFLEVTIVKTDAYDLYARQ